MLTACSLKPGVKHPELAIGAKFKRQGIWKPADPAAHMPRGNWWRAFGDRELASLIERVNVSNQSLESSAASAREANALLLSARLAFLPTADANASYTRSDGSSDGSSGGTGGGVRSQKSVSLNSSWELDLWGRLRHSARGVYANAEAANADVESLKLSLQAQTAQTYFSLRAVDAQRDLLDRQITNYERSLELTKNRYSQGVANRGDVAQAEAQLASTRASAIDLGAQRATLENALAVLTGNAPSALSIGKSKLADSAPRVPASTPSELLERRPDIAAAERRVAAANERIGAAKAAFFPTITLSADGGWRGSQLFTAPTKFWSLGPELAAPLLDGGQRLAEKRQADASYDRTVADYRQTVLTALQETEDALATLRVLEQESSVQQQAVKAARESERIAMNQYKAGTRDYLAVVSAQATALNAERSALDLQVRQLNTTVSLIKAIGGGW